jgi:putative DNA primase/helicase
MYKVSIRYNVIKNKLLVIYPGHNWSIDNADNVAMTRIISLAELNGLSTSKVPSYILAIADEKLYNPVAEWILSKPWDGKNRLSDICETITERDDYPVRLKIMIIIKWLLSAVAAVLMPNGFKARGVLTLQGKQGLGKTSWLMSLVPDIILREMVLKVDHHLDGSNKDSIINAISHWLVEIGELDSSFRKDIARLKGFITSDFDKIRRPYAHAPSEYPRRTVFFASVNQADFLVDSTGNSRWWTIPVEAVNYQHKIDMQQVFAQLAVDFYKGKEWWLSPEEENLLEQQNREHCSISVIREQLLEIIDTDLIGKDKNPAMTATEVLKHLNYNNPSNAKARECGAILRELLGDSKKIKGIHKWRIPLKRNVAPYTSINDHEDEDMK